MVILIKGKSNLKNNLISEIEKRGHTITQEESADSLFYFSDTLSEKVIKTAIKNNIKDLIFVTNKEVEIKQNDNIKIWNINFIDDFDISEKVNIILFLWTNTAKRLNVWNLTHKETPTMDKLRNMGYELKYKRNENEKFVYV